MESRRPEAVDDDFLDATIRLLTGSALIGPPGWLPTRQRQWVPPICPFLAGSGQSSLRFRPDSVAVTSVDASFSASVGRLLPCQSIGCRMFGYLEMLGLLEFFRCKILKPTLSGPYLVNPWWLGTKGRTRE